MTSKESHEQRNKNFKGMSSHQRKALIRKKMKDVFKDVQNGKFADEFVKEIKSGSNNFNKLRRTKVLQNDI